MVELEWKVLKSSYVLAAIIIAALLGSDIYIAHPSASTASDFHYIASPSASAAFISSSLSGMALAKSPFLSFFLFSRVLRNSIGHYVRLSVTT